MIAIMRDGMGVGLAATQLGVLRRAARLPGRRRQRADGAGQPGGRVDLGRVLDRRGGLPQPAAGLDGRRAPAARPLQRPRRRGRADRDRGLGPRGARAPARDRPPRRGPDPRPHRPRAAQGRAAGAARGRQLQPAGRGRGRSRRASFASRAPTREDRLPRHLRLRRHRPAPARRLRRTSRRWSSPRPTAAGPRPPGSRRRRPPRRQPSWGSSCCRPRTSTTRPALERIRAAEPEAVVVCAFGQLIREPLLSELAGSSTCIPRCCRAGAGRRRSSGRSWPATVAPASA